MHACQVPLLYLEPIKSSFTVVQYWYWVQKTMVVGVSTTCLMSTWYLVPVGTKPSVIVKITSLPKMMKYCDKVKHIKNFMHSKGNFPGTIEVVPLD